jgi:hypothetical protein
MSGEVSVFIAERCGGRPGYSICANIWEGRLNGHPTCIAITPIINAAFFWQQTPHLRASWIKRTTK